MKKTNLEKAILFNCQNLEVLKQTIKESEFFYKYTYLESIKNAQFILKEILKIKVIKIKKNENNKKNN